MRNWIVRVVHISEKQEDIQSEDGQGHQLMGKTLQFDFCILNYVFGTCSFGQEAIEQVKIIIKVIFHNRGSSNVACSELHLTCITLKSV